MLVERTDMYTLTTDDWVKGYSMFDEDKNKNKKSITLLPSIVYENECESLLSINLSHLCLIYNQFFARDY